MSKPSDPFPHQPDPGCSRCWCWLCRTLVDNPHLYNLPDWQLHFMAQIHEMAESIKAEGIEFERIDFQLPEVKLDLPELPPLQIDTKLRWTRSKPISSKGDIEDNNIKF